MKFSDLTKSDIKKIAKIHSDTDMGWKEKMEILMTITGKGERTTRYWVKKLGLNNKDEDYNSKHFEEAKKRSHDKKKKRFLISWGQNQTDVNKPLLFNMQAYAKKIDAQIIIIPGRYHSPTSLKTSTYEEDFWDDSIASYLCAKRLELSDKLCVIADIKMQATCVSPLASIEGISAEKSCIVGHPRIQMKTVPTLEDEPVIMMTTGAITKINFTDSRIGKLSEFHFCPGFICAELDKDSFHMRQIISDKRGNFNDLFFNVTDGKVTENKSVPAAIFGDIHTPQEDKKVVDSALNVLCKKIHPQKIFLHDIFNCGSVGHHTLKNPFELHKREMEGKSSLSDEIEEMFNWLEKVKDYNVFVVRSNHDEHLDRFLEENDWRKLNTFKNSIPLIDLTAAVLKGEAPKGAIPYLINKRFPKIKCLAGDESYKIKGIELGLHGHRSPNGSRNSAGLKKLNTKIIIGHSHQPSRYGGAITVGTFSKLKMGYNDNSPSSWAHSMAIIFDDGKVQSIFFDKNAKFTTFK